MGRDGDGRERTRLRRAAANDNGGPEARIEAAVMTLARLTGRRIAREQFARQDAANDNVPTTMCRRARPARDRRTPMTLRAALYARYSSDLQRQASIEDQFRVCQEHAEREGWSIAGCYRDSAASGASVILRPGIQMLLEDARRGRFEVLAAARRWTG